MTVRRFLLVFVVVLATACASFAAEPEASLYDRVAAGLEARPQLEQAIGERSMELEQARWLVGRWSVTARVFATARTPERIEQGQTVVDEILGGTWLQFHDSYRGRLQDQGFLTFNPASQRWLSIGMDKIGNAIVSTAPRWDAGRIVFLAPDAEVLGERVVLRQTMEKQSNDSYRLLNEERLPSGRWIALDEYVYVRQR
ncbi:MAG TPA: DUF1579 family protein [Thermoanaerobaculia bacterium]|nr:DUF1579 family protein [Thermoanaerobaculia bacterium]